jgi:hypothetical protein
MPWVICTVARGRMPHGGNHFRTKIRASSTSDEKVKVSGASRTGAVVIW